MATPPLAKYDGNQMDGRPNSAVHTVTSCMSLFFLMHPSETRWGEGLLHFSEL